MKWGVVINTINRSVGRGCDNLSTDVRKVQVALNLQRGKTGLLPLTLDGKVGPKTFQAIETFQEKVLNQKKPDGCLRPGDEDLNELFSGNEVDSLSVELEIRALAFSSRGSTLLKSIEQLRLTPYDDQSGKDITEWVHGATIGYGHLIARGNWSAYKDGITKVQAEALFMVDISPFENAVREGLTRIVTINEFDALVMLAYNIGVDAFKKSSVLKLVNDPSAKTSYSDLESAWKAWNKSQGKVMRGLNNRRNSEWDVYTNSVYKGW